MGNMTWIPVNIFGGFLQWSLTKASRLPAMVASLLPWKSMQKQALFNALEISQNSMIKTLKTLWWSVTPISEVSGPVFFLRIARQHLATPNLILLLQVTSSTKYSFILFLWDNFKGELEVCCRMVKLVKISSWYTWYGLVGFKIPSFFKKLCGPLGTSHSSSS